MPGSCFGLAPPVGSAQGMVVMLRSDQVPCYFLTELEKFRFFVEISERHWKEELHKYTTAINEDDDAVCWERYKYKNDLSAHLQLVFPQYQKQSYLVTLVSLFEDCLNQLCCSIQHEQGLSNGLRDMPGFGIERAKDYLTKFTKIRVPVGTSCWNQITEAQKIRNVITHNAGHLDKAIHSKHFQIVEKNAHLNIEEFARVHLYLDSAYVLQLITALENVVIGLWKNARAEI